jgi:Tol biopolymer transport system component/DNA-binding winged helix-turn-helix (wHTH) protein
LDPVAKALYRDNQLVEIPPKAVEILCVLLESRNQLVSKSELLDLVWPNRVVSEANLTQNISVLRKSLGEHADWIQTYSGRGYQFIGEVLEDEPSEVALDDRIQDLGPDPSRSSLTTPFEALENPSIPDQALWLREATPLLLAGGVIVAILIGIRFLGPSLLGSNKAETTLTRLSFLEGEEYQPAISPDGRHVAFTWMPVLNQPAEVGSSPAILFPTSGPSQVMLTNLEGSESRRVDPGLGPAASPAWSPDGRRLAMAVHHQGMEQVTIVTLDGSERPFVLAEVKTEVVGPRYSILDWSPDGKTLAVAHCPSGEDRQTISLIDLQERRLRQLTSVSLDDRGHFAPRFSPDGEKLAYIRFAARNDQSVVVLSIKDGRERTVFGGGKISGLTWSRDSDTLLISSNSSGSRVPSEIYRLWRASATGRFEPNPDVAPIPGNGVHLALAASGNDLVYAPMSSRHGIWELSLRANGQQPVTRPLIFSNSSDFWPAYSPDGRSILFLSDRSGSEQIWLAEPDGSNQRQLTRHPILPTLPDWSPDSTRVLFGQREIGVRGALVQSIAISDSSVRREHPSFRAFHVAYAPNGTILASDGEDCYEIIPGAKQRLLLQTGALKIRGSLDGKSLYLVRRRLQGEIWRFRLDGRNPNGEVVVRDLCSGCWAFWTPAPEGLYYAASSEKGIAIRRWESTSGQSRTVATFPGIPPSYQGGLSVSPDRTKLLISLTAPTTSNLIRWSGRMPGR